MSDLIVSDFSKEQVDLIKRTIAIGATDDELSLFLFQAKKTGLDPLKKEIYFIKVGGRVQTITSIDGMRLVADRSGNYEGQTQPVFYDSDGKSYDIWLKKEPPFACKVGVWKKNFKEPLYAVAIFSEYAKGNLWLKMPSLMIAKVAEALALRKAFPNDMGGIYTRDEMEQAHDFKEEKKEVLVDEVKVKILSDLILESKTDLEKFLAHAKVKSLNEINLGNYETLKKLLLLKIEAMPKPEKKEEVIEAVSFTIDDVEFDETGKIK